MHDFLSLFYYRPSGGVRIFPSHFLLSAHNFILFRIPEEKIALYYPVIFHIFEFFPNFSIIWKQIFLDDFRGSRLCSVRNVCCSVRLDGYVNEEWPFKKVQSKNRQNPKCPGNYIMNVRNRQKTKFYRQLFFSTILNMGLLDDLIMVLTVKKSRF